MRAHWTSLPVVAAVAVVGIAACSNDDDPQSGPTLPPIATSSTTSTTLAVATTLPQYYEVKRGDTLTLIAAAYAIPVQALMDANRGHQPRRHPGRAVPRHPAPRGHRRGRLAAHRPGPDGAADADPRRSNDRRTDDHIVLTARALLRATERERGSGNQRPASPGNAVEGARIAAGPAPRLTTHELVLAHR